jgi:large subunit ribosomal protein L1
MNKTKKYLAASKLVDKNKKYPILEATELVKKMSTVKFTATIEAAFHLNLNPRKSEQNLRGALVLPHGLGNKTVIVAICIGDKVKEAQEAGADYVGDKDLIDKIGQGWLDFTSIVATPDMMPQLSKLGRVLGPKGLMPNPKTGTVTLDVTKAITEIKNGKVEYRVDETGNIHVPVGKTTFTADQVKANLVTIYQQLVKARPTTIKGTYVKNISICATMTPGVKIAEDSLR